MAVLASGRGSNLQALLRQTEAGNVAATVTMVVSDKPEAGALALAHAHRVPAVVALPPEPGEKRAAFDARLLDALRSEAPDLVVLAGYMRLVGAGITSAFRDRIVNIHPSLLPSFRGLQGVQQAQAAGVRIAGCTTHVVTDDLDGGPIVLQAALATRSGEPLEGLQRRVLALEHLLLPRTVDLFARGEARVEDGRVRLSPSASWLDGPARYGLVGGALYGEGF